MRSEAVAEGSREFDFLRGGENYKYSWGAADRWSGAADRAAMNRAVRPSIDRYRAGDISAEIAVMRAALALGTADAVRGCLEKVGDGVLARASRDPRAGPHRGLVAPV